MSEDTRRIRTDEDWSSQLLSCASESEPLPSVLRNLRISAIEPEPARPLLRAWLPRHVSADQAGVSWPYHGRIALRHHGLRAVRLRSHRSSASLKLVPVLGRLNR